MKKPNRADCGSIDSNDLDAEWAFKNFSEKSFDEAKAMFQDNALYYQEGLESMPSKALNFYAPALAEYIISDQAEHDSDGASSFLHMIVRMFKTRHEIISDETKHLLICVSEKVAGNQEFYDADLDIYGEFSENYFMLHINFTFSSTCQRSSSSVRRL